MVKEAIEKYTNLQDIEIRLTIGKAEELLPKWVKNGFQIELLIVDPPRTGLDPKLLKMIIQVKPKRFIYVSYNPSTLGKDLSILLKEGYKVKYIQPVDIPADDTCG